MGGGSRGSYRLLEGTWLAPENPNPVGLDFFRPKKKCKFFENFGDNPQNNQKWPFKAIFGWTDDR